MIQISNKEDCCGCTACASICPHNAISMMPDSMGFLYPKVDITKCVECGLCENICAFNDNYNCKNNLDIPLSFGARHKNPQEIETSRSGAAFIAISDIILNSGGVVYGAGYTDHFRITHKKAHNGFERNEFKGSKYVQSDLTGIFKQIKKDIQNGIIVLFSGTPCQTAGLASFLGEKLRNKLYLIDIVCHGVLSPYIWRDFIKYIETKHGSTLTVVNFRDKKYGWSKHHETYRFADGSIENNFELKFYRRIIFRYSCGKCHYANLKRPSDITLGDFWGWEKVNPEFNKDDKGISLVLVNTDRGKLLFETAKTKLNIFSCDLNQCLQPNLIHPTELHPKRYTFEELYSRKGFIKAMRRYGEIGWRYKLLKPIMALLKNPRILKIKILIENYENRHFNTASSK